METRDLYRQRKRVVEERIWKIRQIIKQGTAKQKYNIWKKINIFENNISYGTILVNRGSIPYIRKIFL